MCKEIVITDTIHVKCSGPEAPHDHPIVYYVIPLEKRNHVVCFYCGRMFVYDDGGERW